jgi:hypothetical protein
MLYTCTLSRMPFPRLDSSKLGNGSIECLTSLHAVASWSVSIVLAFDKIVRIVILKLLLKRQRIKLATKSKLAINFLLANIVVLYIEEAYRIVQCVSDQQDGEST